MATYHVVETEQLESQLTELADAIRGKTGENEALTISDMAGKIRQLGAWIINTVQGNPVTLTDSLDTTIRGLKLFGKTTQDSTPTPEAPVPLVSAGNNGNFTVTILGDEVEDQSLAIQTPNGLPGISVTTGGNYTDETGQQWICDEVDFTRGVYVQRIFRTIFKSAVGWSIAGASNGSKRFYTNQFMGVIKNTKDDATKGCGLCSHFINVTPADTWYEVTGISINSKGRLDIYYSGIEQTTAALEEYFVSNPVAFMAELATPIETPLSAEEPAAYAALHTNYPNTTILNDGGAGMEVSYVADTKLYIDNKINAMAAAIVNA